VDGRVLVGVTIVPADGWREARMKDEKGRRLTREVEKKQEIIRRNPTSALVWVGLGSRRRCERWAMECNADMTRKEGGERTRHGLLVQGLRVVWVSMFDRANKGKAGHACACGLGPSFCKELGARWCIVGGAAASGDVLSLASRRILKGK
jgi:hypothetical protein